MIGLHLLDYCVISWIAVVLGGTEAAGQQRVWPLPSLNDYYYCVISWIAVGLGGTEAAGLQLVWKDFQKKKIPHCRKKNGHHFRKKKGPWPVDIFLLCKHDNDLYRALHSYYLRFQAYLFSVY